MGVLTLIDRILLGRVGSERARAAERRYQAAEASRRRLDEDVEAGREELAAAVAEAKATAKSVVETPPVSGIAAQELLSIVDEPTDKSEPTNSKKR